MDRTIIYPLAQGRSFDMLHGWKDQMLSMSRFTSAVLNNGDVSVIHGFQPAQTSPTASLTIDIAEGQCYQRAQVDDSPFGSIASDSTEIFQQGYSPAQQLTLSVAGIGGGQARWALIQCSFEQQDSIRVGDPTDGVQLFFNSEDPTDPFLGPTGQGETSDSVRQGVAVLSVKYGAIAATLSAVPPAKDAGNVPVYLIKLTSGMSQITTPDIQLAGPDAYAGYENAPFFAGLMNTHHLGINGHAPKVSLILETTDILPLARCEAAPIIGAGSPVGAQAGVQGQKYLDATNGVWWYCQTSGDSSTTLWHCDAVPPVIEVTAFPFTPTILFATYRLKPASGGQVVNLPAITSTLRAKMTFINTTAFQVVLTPAASETVSGQSTQPIDDELAAITIQPFHRASPLLKDWTATA